MMMKIAVVGIACRYPGANSAVELYENLLAGRRAFRTVPDVRWSKADYYHPDPKHPDTSYCKKAALIDGFTFNPAEYRIPRSTHIATDIAQWITLQVCKEALADAGIPATASETTGVIIGNTLTGEITRAYTMRYRWPYVARIIDELLDSFGIDQKSKDGLMQMVEKRYKAPFPEVNEDNLAGALSNTIAGRVCNYFDFKGGGFTTDGACSSSLLAINQAFIALANGVCDVALAGGVDISLDPFEMVGFAKVGALSQTDIRVYDNYSDGFLPGEGCGIVVLQRYDDAIAQNKKIYAVIHGIGISSDGKGGITAPNVEGQSFALQRAYRMAEYDFADIELIEGHGTGTPTGDQVELTNFIQSINASNPPAGHRCGIGSIKSNIGHTKAAAGAAGFIKAVMSVCHGVIPPTMGIRTPNKLFATSEHLYPLLNGRIWSDADKPRRAAVSSAGFGGINTHITVASTPANPRTSEAEQARYAELIHSSQLTEVILIGADNSKQLKRIIQDILPAAEQISYAELADLAQYCVQNYSATRIRLGLVVMYPEELVSKLNTVLDYLDSPATENDVKLIDKKNHIYLVEGLKQPKIAYLFPGQASQHINMGRNLLHRSEIFAETMQSCNAILQQQHNINLFELIYRDIDSMSAPEAAAALAQLNNTAITQPAVVAHSLAALHYLRDLGIRPELAIGHSLGEYTALYSAGALSLEQTMDLVASRGQAMAESTGIPSGMISVALDVAASKQLLEVLQLSESDYLGIANINAPQQTILSGSTSALERVQEYCQQQQIKCKILPVSAAFHSKLMATAAASMQEKLTATQFKHLRHLVISTNTADFYFDPRKINEVLAEQICAPVNFVAAIQTAAAEEIEVYIEVGPGSVLTNLTQTILADSDALICSMDTGVRGEQSAGLHNLVAYLFSCGMPLATQKLFAGRLIKPFALPYQKDFIQSPCELAVEPLVVQAQISANEFNFQLDTTAVATNTQQQGNVAELVTATGAEAVMALFKKQIVADFGYSEDMITANSTLLDDLGLDSLKSVELVYEVMGTLGVKSDASNMTAKPLGELAEFIAKLVSDNTAQHQPAAKQAKDERLSTPQPAWVNAFAPELIPQPLTNAKPELQQQTILLVTEQVSATTKAIGAALSAAGAIVIDMLVGRNVVTNHKLDACIYIANQSENLKDALDITPDSLSKKYQRPQALLQLAQRILKAANGESARFFMLATEGNSFWQQSQSANSQSAGAIAGPGFVKTLKLENANLTTRCIEFAETLEAKVIAGYLQSELVNDHTHADVYYAKAGLRQVLAFKATSPAQYPTTRRAIAADSVVLLTGAGKGITAECALTLGQATGAKIAILGSSPHPGKSTEGELAQNLRRFAENQLEYAYFQCDMTSAESVSKVLAEVQGKLGKVTDIIHAAGVNNLQKIATAEWESYLRVIEPKYLGLVNLLNNLKIEDLNVVGIFSSVIANSGMSGNAEYAYANEWCNQLLRNLAVKYPEVSFQAFGFSVWSNVGMGARHGSTDLLANMGINSIRLDKGCQIFNTLIAKHWPTTNLMISSRMGALGTLNFAQSETTPMRFTGKTVYRVPGVELVTEIELTPVEDSYLHDHDYEGSKLFPAVMGIEAMAQAAASCIEALTGKLPSSPVLENLQFERAVIVPDSGRNIRIYVQIEPVDAAGNQRAAVVLRSAASNYNDDHFALDCVWYQHTAQLGKLFKNTQSYLPLQPQQDLYGHLLFQGAMFQNIVGYKYLTATECVVDIRVPEQVSLFKTAANNQQLLLGSGQVRDAFLHAVQICVPDYKILPVSMAKIIHGEYQPGSIITLHAKEVLKTDKEFLYNLAAYDQNGRCIEIIDGFRCRIMKPYSDKANIELIKRARSAQESVIAAKAG